jgi:deazaflavin-dependent oxidoreductase (nitroreductase family)
MPLIDFSHKPTGWLRWMLRAPSYVYRARLGIVFGYRFVMIEHRGRKTGKRHFTVVEVARHLAREWVCTSGTGPGADWYRNLQAGGLEAVWVGSRRHRASVRFLEETEAADVMGAYQRAHPKTAAKLYSMMGVSYDGTDEGRVEMLAKIPMVAFRPEDVNSRATAFL